MKEQFSRHSGRTKYYDDVGEKILKDYAAMMIGWPNGAQVPLPPSFDNFIILSSQIPPFPGMENIGYAEFRDLYAKKKILMVHENHKIMSANLFGMQKEGLENILRSPTRLHLPLINQMAMATMINLDDADYLYARCAVVADDGLTSPAKSIVLKKNSAGEQLKAVVTFDPAFMDRYMVAKEKAAGTLSDIMSKSSHTWRVPNISRNPYLEL